MTIFWLCLVVGALALHELVAWRAGTRYSKRAALRQVLLLVLLAAAVGLGSRPPLINRLAALTASPPRPLGFDPGGDPALRLVLQEQRPERPFPDGGSRDEVSAWQQHVIDAIRARAEISGDPPQHVPVTILESTEIGAVRRSFVRFTSDDGTSIPAYVHEPIEGGTFGGVLVVPGHGSGIRATAGLISDYQHGAALELAKHGYVTLTPELRGFGFLTADGASTHRAVAFAALEAGSFYKAAIVRDLRLALTVLQQWDRIDPSRLAVAGTSLGAEIAVLLGVVDSRPRVILSHSYGGASGPVRVAEWVTDETRQTPHGCHTIPGINRIVWHEDWFRLLAPRAVLVARGATDMTRSPDAFRRAVGDAFEAFGAGDRFEFSVHEGDHEFFITPAVDFLRRWL